MGSEQARESYRGEVFGRGSGGTSPSGAAPCVPSPDLAVLGGWDGPLRAALADLYVGCALLATGGLYLDALGLPSRRSTLEGHLQNAVLVAGVDLLLLYTFW